MNSLSLSEFKTSNFNKILTKKTSDNKIGSSVPPNSHRPSTTVHSFKWVFVLSSTPIDVIKILNIRVKVSLIKIIIAINIVCRNTIVGIPNRLIYFRLTSNHNYDLTQKKVTTIFFNLKV